MKYEIGKWYPREVGKDVGLHPKTIVEWLNTQGDKFETETLGLCWDDKIHPVIAFRVIKEHKEPREFWAAQGEMCKCGQHGWIEVDRDCAPYATLFREVQP